METWLLFSSRDGGEWMMSVNTLVTSLIFYIILNYGLFNLSPIASLVLLIVSF